MFNFQVTEPSPSRDSSGVRQQGGLLGPPPQCVLRVYFQGHRVCVLSVYFFKDTEPSPLQDFFSVRITIYPSIQVPVRQKGGSISQVGSGPNCFQALGSYLRGLLRVTGSSVC